MALGVNELEDLIEEVQEKVRENIFRYNISGELDEYLLKIGYEEHEERYYERDSKILIIGESQINKDDIIKIAKKNKIDRNYLELELGYNTNKNYNFVKLEYNTNYRCVLIGPLPHSTKGRGDYNSVISKMEKENDKYPPIYRLESNNRLKITKSNLEKSFRKIKEIYFS